MAGLARAFLVETARAFRERLGLELVESGAGVVLVPEDAMIVTGYAAITGPGFASAFALSIREDLACALASRLGAGKGLSRRVIDAVSDLVADIASHAVRRAALRAVVAPPDVMLGRQRKAWRPAADSGSQSALFESELGLVYVESSLARASVDEPADRD
jgi:hypothetical protein